MKKTSFYNKKWITNFKNDIFRFIKQNEIINSDQIYNIYYQKYGKKNWGSGLLQKLYKIIDSDDRLTQVDLLVPSENNEKVILFKGHQGIKQVSFFVMSSMDDKIKRCTEELNSLLKNAAHKKKSKGETKKIKNNPHNTLDLGMNFIKQKNITRSTSQSLIMKSPGYISSKVLRCHLLHRFLFDTFGLNCFSIDNIYQNMPIDLYFKIIGSIKIPKILIQYPSLRFVLIKSFPIRILEEIDFDFDFTQIRLLLNKLEKGFKVCIFQNNKYKLIGSFLICDSLISFPLYFDRINHKFNDIDLFWRFVELSNKKENNDVHSNNLWKKRWTVQSYFMNPPEEKTVLKNLVKKILFYSHSVRFYDELVHILGYEKNLFLDFVPSFNNLLLANDDSIVLKFCQNFSFQQPQIKKCSCFKLKDYANINDYEDNIQILKLIFKQVCKERVTTNGVIHKIPINWNKIILKAGLKHITSSSLKTKIHNLVYANNEMNSKKKYILSSTVQSAFLPNENRSESDFFPLNTNQILNYFDIFSKQFVIDNSIGELIEAVKRIIICNQFYYYSSCAEALLYNCKFKYLNEAILFLKMTNFCNIEKTTHGSTPKKNFKNIFYKTEKFSIDLKSFTSMYKSLSFNNIMLSENLMINHATVYILLYQNIDQGLLNPNFKVEKKMNFDIKKANNIRINKNLTVKFKIGFKCFPLPFLLDFEVDQISQSPNHQKIIPSIYKENSIEFIQNSFAEFMVLGTLTNNLNLVLSPFMLYSYGFILHERFDGLDINQLRQMFHLEYENQNFDILLKCLDFLLEFHFIQKKSSTAALPLFVADAFYINSFYEERQHLWTSIFSEKHNLTDELLLNKQVHFIFEQVELKPGIEINDLYLSVSYLSLSDFLDILNILILDEAIYMTTTICNVDNSLFEDSIDIPINNFHINHLLIIFYLEQTDPNFNKPTIRLFPSYGLPAVQIY